MNLFEWSYVMLVMIEFKLIVGNVNWFLVNVIVCCMLMYCGMNVVLIEVCVECFNDQEIFVEVYENVCGEDMFIIQLILNLVNDNLMELLIMMDVLKCLLVSCIIVVIFYFGYVWQDCCVKVCMLISVKLVVNLLIEVGVDRVLMLDLYVVQIQGFFDILVDNLYVVLVFVLDIQYNFCDQMLNLMVILFDVGGVVCVCELVQCIGVLLVIVDKCCEKFGEIVEMIVIGDVIGKICIIVDDICDIVGMLCKVVEVLIEYGVVEVYVYIIYGVLFGFVVEWVSKLVMKLLVIIDFIEFMDKVCGVGNICIVLMVLMFVQVILNIWNGILVSFLFEIGMLGLIYEGFYSLV